MWFSVLFAKAVGDEDCHHCFSYPTVYFNQAQNRYTTLTRSCCFTMAVGS
jgi:hypothetical protein